ncbi:hypothetical protein LBMAG46_22160 [Planctomycetia bacterium]|nr:hypothetical protein LBMAG46_22160 [Planctomycetia bacterium]
MSASVSHVFLRDGSAGGLILADLYDAILPKHLDDHEQHWKPLIASQATEHGHWDWRKKESRLNANAQRYWNSIGGSRCSTQH